MSPNLRPHHAIPDTVTELMEEVYIALQNGSRQLVIMGTRAVLESIMASKVGHHKSFNTYLNAFQKAYFISSQQRENLDVVLNAGNAATHKAWKGNDRQLAAIIEITESWVEMIYLHQLLARELESGVPRPPPQPAPEVFRRRKRPQP
jgi:hypothetical protein